MTITQKKSVEIQTLVAQKLPVDMLKEPIFYQTYTGIKQLADHLGLTMPVIKYDKHCGKLDASRILGLQNFILYHMRDKL